MFGWGKKEGGEQDKKKDAPAAAGQPGSTSPVVSTTQAQPDLAASNEQVDILQALPKPSSVFEFGATVQLGQDSLRGVCTGDDPDAIQACTWSIEPVTNAKPKEKRSMYRIEF